MKNRRRFIDGEITDKPNPRQLEKANRILESSREAIAAGIPTKLELVNATPQSAIGWPHWRPW